MFKRRKLQADEQAFLSEEALATPSEDPEETVDLRTTCYPQATDASPAAAGLPRTTVYRQSLAWSRRGYDHIN